MGAKTSKYGTMTQGRSPQLQGYLGVPSFIIMFAFIICGLAYQLWIAKFMLCGQTKLHQEVRKEGR